MELETIPIVYLSPYRIHEGGNCGFTDYYIQCNSRVSILEYPLLYCSSIKHVSCMCWYTLLGLWLHTLVKRIELLLINYEEVFLNVFNAYFVILNPGTILSLFTNDRGG